MPARFDIAMQRNEDFGCALEVTDNSGAAIDLTGWSLAFTVKERLSDTGVLQTGDVEFIDAATGWINLRLQGPGAALGAYGDLLLTYELPFDLVATAPDGAPMALFAGYVILSRGIS
ncbi:hypothetical protein GG804_27230 [Sphingomonas histidinilytica]|uniref:hypothetical protein n=1 Tax=Rhizorhabdus histidinilytica TaxID=439228 RepID=UPI001ADA6EC0|nr:hypothetical protein [Rhizorhabdus histidinilytica]MBO9380461.1 hypothetical protein [Rhizorhabdus histidinilytica]